MPTRVLGLLLFVGLAACQPVTVQRSDEGGVPVTVRVDDAAYWLEEWYRLKDLPEAQLVEIVARRRQEFEQSPVPRNRLRLALLLAEGPAPVRDQPQAQRLLRELDPAEASASAKALAALLEQVIAEVELGYVGPLTNVVWAISEGREVARCVDEYLTGTESLLPKVRLDPYDY